MGNFKPQAHHYVEMGGRRRVLLKEETEILQLLKDGYWVEQNITQPRAIWLKHHREHEQPNITWNTFDRLVSRKFVKEHGTLHPIARFTITKQGEMEYDRLTKPKEEPKPVPVPPDMDVSPKPPVTAFEVSLKASDRSLLEQQLKTSIGMVAHSVTRVQNLYILNVIFDDHLQLLKAEALLGLSPDKIGETEKPKNKKKDYSKSFEKAYVQCHYCKIEFAMLATARFKEKRWHRACKNCTSKRAAEYNLFRQVYGRTPNENDE